MKLGKLSQYEKILAYMRDPTGDKTDLSPHDQRTLDRWMEAFTLMRNYNSSADTAAILMKRFPDISRATAYRDCANSVSLFGDMSKATKEGYRHLATEITRDGIAIARLKNNEDAMIKGANAIAKINGVNLNDPDLPDFGLLEPHTYEFALPEGFMTLFKDMISGGVIDLAGAVNNMALSAEEAILELPGDE